MKRVALLLALAQAGAMALAQAPAGAAVAAASYECGGASQPESEAMRARAGRHDLVLTFAETTGALLAEVEVEIRDGRGTVVLSARCDGPIMLVDLPRAGRWRITARSHGQAQRRTISTTRGKTARAALLWPARTSEGKDGG